MTRNASLVVASCAAALAFVLSGAPAAAQDKRSPPPASSAQPAAAPGSAPPAGEAKAADAKAPDGPKTVTGYGYSDPPKRKAGAPAPAPRTGRGKPGPRTARPAAPPPPVVPPHADDSDSDSDAADRDSAPAQAHVDRTPPAARRLAASAGPTVTLPGFEMLADGASRCFVQISKPVQVDETKTASTVTYLLKGAHSSLRNNHNALETVHFNTPVTRARVVQTPRGPAFVLDLRASVAPSYKLAAGKDGSSILQIDFPKGDYLPTADARPADQARLDGHK